MSDYLNDFRNSMETIRQNAWELKDLSEAFYTTGNFKLGEKLESQAQSLLVAEEQAQNAISQSVNEQLTASFQATENMLKACCVVSGFNEDSKYN